VTDGFTGNVALKTLEGAGAFATQQVRAALTGSAAARFGAAANERTAADRQQAAEHNAGGERPPHASAPQKS